MSCDARVESLGIGFRVAGGGGKGHLSEGGVEGDQEKLALQVAVHRPVAKVGAANGCCYGQITPRRCVPATNAYVHRALWCMESGRFSGCQQALSLSRHDEHKVRRSPVCILLAHCREEARRKGNVEERQPEAEEPTTNDERTRLRVERVGRKVRSWDLRQVIGWGKGDCWDEV